MILDNHIVILPYSIILPAIKRNCIGPNVKTTEKDGANTDRGISKNSVLENHLLVQ